MLDRRMKDVTKIKMTDGIKLLGRCEVCSITLFKSLDDTTVHLGKKSSSTGHIQELEEEQQTRKKGELTNESLLELLKAGKVKQFNLMRNEHRISPDFANTDLRNADLEHADLMGANLMGADLRSANLERTYLIDANLGAANLMDANLEMAYLMGADLRSANLERTNLNGADLKGAKLDR
jgi:hypothetical protein